MNPPLRKGEWKSSRKTIQQSLLIFSMLKRKNTNSQRFKTQLKA